MRVSVCCFAKFHSFHLAEQLHKRNSLESLYTSFYGKIGNKQNNFGIELPGTKVQTNLFSALIHYGYNPFSEIWGHDVFGKWAAKHIFNENIVVTWGLSALPIIQKARERNIISIVERGSAHATTQRNLLIEEYEKYGQPTNDLRRSFSSERMERELLEYELTDYIEVPSEFARRTFVEQGVPETKLIKGFLGVDLSLFEELPKSDDVFRVIYTGQMSLQKGVHYLLQAFAELRLPNAELWLIGSLNSEIEPFFNKYRAVFRHIAPVAQEELYRYFAQGSIFVICSIQDGFGQVLPQAMACGLPVIATENTGASDVIEDGLEGFTIPIRDVAAIKEKILYFYEDPEACYEMGQAAKRKVRQGLTWNDYGDFILKTYTRIVEEKQGRVNG